MKEQLKLWRHAEKKEQWEDVPAKVKVETEDGLCHVDMVFTLGLPPQAAYDVLTNPDNQSYSRIINQRHELLVFLLCSYHCMIQMSIRVLLY